MTGIHRPDEFRRKLTGIINAHGVDTYLDGFDYAIAEEIMRFLDRKGRKRKKRRDKNSRPITLKWCPSV